MIDRFFMKAPQHLSFMEIHLVEAVLLHVEEQTDGTQHSLDTFSATMQTWLKTNFYSRFLPLAKLDLSQ